MTGRIIALAGNPNVGKSTVFNGLTGLRQHTGNWPGKTVEVAKGQATHGGIGYALVDLPGSYSLLAHSGEEEIARDFLCFEKYDAAVVVLDACCLERNLNLALQVLEAQPRTVLCVNLMDEAEKKRIAVDVSILSKRLGVPVVGCAAGHRKGLNALMDAVALVSDPKKPPPTVSIVQYPPSIEQAIQTVADALPPKMADAPVPARWAALRLLEGDASLLHSLEEALQIDLPSACGNALQAAWAFLADSGIPRESLRDRIVESLYGVAESLCAACVRSDGGVNHRQLQADRLLTGRWIGIPVMLALLALVFWITLTGANGPSAWLAKQLTLLEGSLTHLLQAFACPPWLIGAFIQGAFRTLAWVVSVMLPPMAIFFPFFTLLEDAGYLPRVAFNLDRHFKRCGVCGKQALTMCMGLGCNAVGVAGCRIIDSPRERLIAILTNCLVPCNGRFPMMIAVLAMFFAGSGALSGAVLPAVLLAGVIATGVLATLGVSLFLSKTLLKGIPSSFTLELPPYRWPRIGQVVVRSLLDRTVFVLGRAVAFAAPMGLLLWLLANVSPGGVSLLARMTGFLDPLGRLLGMDGVILSAFLLGLPANEIVLPILLMAYLAQGSLAEVPNLMDMKAILAAHGWTWVTAACTLLFSLMHWPCSTTCLTIRKETGSTGWTLLAIGLPTALGMGVCALVALVGRWMGG